jgi:hypothetical protein
MTEPSEPVTDSIAGVYRSGIFFGFGFMTSAKDMNSVEMLSEIKRSRFDSV